MDRDAYWTTTADSFHAWRTAGAENAHRAWRIFDDLVRERLLRYCARALERRRSDIEDAVQEILIRLMEYAAAAPAEADHFRCRFYRIARTICADLKRGPRSRSKSLAGENWVDPRPGSATQVRRKDGEQTLRELVNALPEADAETLRMHYFEHRSPKTIARRQAQKTYVVRRKLEAARESLRPRLIAAGLTEL